jgi:uncharacterized membrane protein
MKILYLLGFVGAFFYGILNALLPKITATVPSPLVIAIYTMIISAGAWIAVFATNKGERVATLTSSEWKYIVLIGIVALAAEFAWFKGFELKIPPMLMFASIASVSVFASLMHCVLTKTSPNPQQIIGILLCVVGAYIVQIYSPQV